MSGSCLSPRDPVGLLGASAEEGGRGIAREISSVETESSESSDGGPPQGRHMSQVDGQSE